MRIHRTLTAEEGRAAAAMSDAEATKRHASAEGDTKAAARAEKALKQARQDYARVPRARAAAKIANGAGLDALDPGQKRALGLTPDGFPLDAAGLVEVGLEQPLVSLGEAGRPVLSPAAVEDIARVSSELADRVEATKRDVLAGGAGVGGPAGSPSGDALLEPGDAGGPDPLGGTGNGDVPPDTGATALGTPGAPASPALPAGKAVPPLARPVAATPPPPAKGQRVSFRRDGVEVQGRANHVFDADRLVVQTDNGPELVETRDLAPLPSLPKQRKAGKQGAGTAFPKPPRRDRSHLHHPSNNPRTRLPQSYGRWDGPEGASNWHSDIPEVNAITGGKPVRFVNGRPVFKPWAVDTITFKPMELDGSKADFTKIYEELARRWNLSGPTAAQEELTRRRLTPHHEDSITIQLVPFDLHNHTEHIGSASDMRNGYRHP